MKRLVVTTIFFAIILYSQVFLGYWFTRQALFNETTTAINNLDRRVHSDITITDKTWDISRYVSDPLTPHPHGSSGFVNPLYIMTVDGQVIERNQPITGILDTSDFNRLSNFQTAQTIKTITGESWRVLSKPIKHEDKTIGLIVIAYYNPPLPLPEDIDKKLTDNIILIENQLDTSTGTINSTKTDIRSINYDVSWEVINQYNKVVVNNGRTPSFIDASYVHSQLTAKPLRIVYDDTKKEHFLVKTSLIYDAQTQVQGIVMTGESLKHIATFTKDYLLFAPLAAGLLTVLFTLIVLYLLKRGFISLHIDPKLIVDNKTITSLRFDKKDSVIYIDNKSVLIPYASNQYELASAIFAAPKKRWEQDELLEKFGEDPTREAWRKVYDAMLAINRKVGTRIIIHKEKTYRLNPEYLSALKD